jgi:hypothetical protein
LLARPRFGLILRGSDGSLNADPHRTLSSSS